VRDQAMSEFGGRDGNGGGVKRRPDIEGPRVRIGVALNGQLRLA